MIDPDWEWRDRTAQEVINILYNGQGPSKYGIMGGGGPNTVRFDYGTSLYSRDGIHMYSQVRISTMWCYKIDGRGKTISTFIDLGWALLGGVTSSKDSVSLRAMTVVSNSVDIHHTIMDNVQTMDFMHELRRMNYITRRVNDILSRGKYKIHTISSPDGVTIGHRYKFYPEGRHE